MQLNLFDSDSERDRADSVVNVASVPQRSPFRYPGGKTWLVPRIRQWLRSISPKSPHLVELFAGGAIAGLTTAAEQLADQVTLVELDDAVAAVWKTILQDAEGDEWLARQIDQFEMSLPAVNALLLKTPCSVRDLAFQTIVRNRVNRGGILAPGAGLIKAGENGRGLTSRWYPATLQNRIRAIVQDRDRLTFVHGDGLQMLAGKHWPDDTVFFIDPPYSAAKTSAGSRLYTHFDLDHARLFAELAALPNDFLMTYDDTPQVRALAGQSGFSVAAVAMKNTHHARKTELLIGRRLGWLSAPDR